MNAQNRHRIHSPAFTACGSLLLIVALSSAPAPTSAIDLQGIDGFLDITAVQSTTDGFTSNTLRQEYTAHLERRLLPYLSLRGSIRYLKFDLEQVVGDVWQQEVQPAGELVWSHPLFHSSVYLQRRSAKSPIGVMDRTTDNFHVSFNSRMTDLPMLRVYYETVRTFNPLDRAIRDAEGQRLNANLGYSNRYNEVTYVYAHDWSGNLVSNLENQTRRHLVRWNGNSGRLLGDRLRTNLGYSFHHSNRITEQVAPGRILELIPTARGLAAETPDPDLVELEEVPGLIDGNFEDATVPVIEIGTGQVQRNIGADFGFSRPVGGVYVYTDVVSGSNLTWAVYSSRDNQEWVEVPGARSILSATANRYEITFPQLEMRYVKVVNGGLNGVESVRVTELQCLQELESIEESSRSEVTQTADLDAAYQLSSGTSLQFTSSVRQEPQGPLIGDRTSTNYLTGLSARQTRYLSHHLRWQQSFQSFSGSASDLRTDILSYSGLIDPLETLGFTFSMYWTKDHASRIETTDLKSVSLEARGAPLDGLHFSLESGFSHREDFTFDQQSEIINHRVSLDGEITPRLDFVASVTIQETTTTPGSVRNREWYTLGGSYLVTQSIYVSGNLRLRYDLTDTVMGDAQATWTMTPRLSAGATASWTDNELSRTLQRRGAHVTYTLGRRSTLYFNYSDNDLAGTIDANVTSYRVGLRAGF